MGISWNVLDTERGTSQALCPRPAKRRDAEKERFDIGIL